MKPATLVSAIRPAAAAVLLLLPLLLIGWAEQVIANPVHVALSPPLRNRDTYVAVREVAQHAQIQSRQAEDGEDTSLRLIPRVDNSLDHLTVCCLHANILDFYLTNILSHLDDEHSQMHRLKVDLSRVSQDLQTNGCNVTHHHDHPHSIEFKQKFHGMGRRGINKAVGEITILFSHLQNYCVQPRNAANADDAQ